MSALETLLAKCSTDAQRVTLLKESVDLANGEADAAEEDLAIAEAELRRLRVLLWSWNAAGLKDNALGRVESEMRDLVELWPKTLCDALRAEAKR